MKVNLKKILIEGNLKTGSMQNIMITSSSYFIKTQLGHEILWALSKLTLIADETERDSDFSILLEFFSRLPISLKIFKISLTLIMVY